MIYGMEEKPIDELVKVSNYSIVTTVFFLALFICLCVALYFILRELVTEKSNIFGFVFTIASTVLSLVYVIVSALYKDAFVSFAEKLGRHAEDTIILSNPHLGISSVFRLSGAPLRRAAIIRWW